MVLIFILGLILGSFYNVLIIRTLNGESIIFPTSHCMECDTPIEWKYKIPILSYIFLKGKCKYCGKPIDIMYPVVELVTGLIFLFLYLKYGISFQFFVTTICASLFLILAGMDIKSNMICSKYATYLIPCSILFNFTDILNSIYGGAVCFGITKILLWVSNKYKKEFLGDGDLHLFTAFGCFVGLSHLLILSASALLFIGITAFVKYINRCINQKNYRTILYLLWFGVAYLLVFFSHIGFINPCLYIRVLIFVNLICALFVVVKNLFSNFKKSQNPLFIPVSPYIFLAVLFYFLLF